MAGDVGVALTGTGARQGDRSQGVNGFFLAAITPETATSCHYFWNFVRSWRTDDEELSGAVLEEVSDSSATRQMGGAR